MRRQKKKRLGRTLGRIGWYVLSVLRWREMWEVQSALVMKNMEKLRSVQEDRGQSWTKALVAESLKEKNFLPWLKRRRTERRGIWGQKETDKEKDREKLARLTNCNKRVFAYQTIPILLLPEVVAREWQRLVTNCGRFTHRSHHSWERRTIGRLGESVRELWRLRMSAWYVSWKCSRGQQLKDLVTGGLCIIMCSWRWQQRKSSWHSFLFFFTIWVWLLSADPPPPPSSPNQNSAEGTTRSNSARETSLSFKIFQQTSHNARIFVRRLAQMFTKDVKTVTIATENVEFIDFTDTKSENNWYQFYTNYKLIGTKWKAYRLLVLSLDIDFVK